MLEKSPICALFYKEREGFVCVCGHADNSTPGGNSEGAMKKRK